MRDSTNRTCLALKQQMYMVGHETVGVEEEWYIDLLSRNQREKLLIVSSGVKDLTTIIAPRDHVVQATLKFGARFSDHRGTDTNPRVVRRQSPF